MERFKKKTLALVLASVVTVVGAFGAENYKNSIMSLNFWRDDSGVLDMSVVMKKDYAETLKLVRKDKSTYVLLLPEVKNEMPAPPDLTDNILNIDVATMPYTTDSKGYTKITIKTNPYTQLTATPALYVPMFSNATGTENGTSETNNTLQSVGNPVVNQNPNNGVTVAPQPKPIKATTFYSTTNIQTVEKAPKEDSTEGFVQNDSPVEEENEISQENTEKTKEENSIASLPPPPTPTVQNNVTEPMSFRDSVYLLIAIIVAFVLVLFTYKKAKTQMRELIGDNSSINIDETKKTKSNKVRKYGSAINSLDKKYPKTNTTPVGLSKIETPPVTTPTVTVEEELNIIDMDELFNETKQVQNDVTINEEEENEALEDFLSAYTFDDDFFATDNKEEETQEEVDEPLFDEELFERCINNSELKFSEADITKINALLSSEINDDTMKNLKKYAVSNPIKKTPTKEQLMEDIVTTYAIKQDISFSNEDMGILSKLLSVEIDNEFITNLKTDPDRMYQMQQEFERQKTQPHKKSELLTLNVKDMLPDLSEALRKQGNKRIESNYKPDVVYYKDGYEVSTLTLQDSMPDLSLEINKKEAYKPRPSDAIQLVESGYDVQTMSISGLPDLRDALLNPDKYKAPEPEVTVVDESVLLKNISNVVFKPFYDGSEPFEVINDFEENNNIEILNAPSISDMQKEFEGFGDLKIVDDEYFDSPDEIQEVFDESEYFKINTEEKVNAPDLDSELAQMFETHNTQTDEELNLNEIASNDFSKMEKEISEDKSNFNQQEQELNDTSSQKNNDELVSLDRKNVIKEPKIRKNGCADLLQKIQEQQIQNNNLKDNNNKTTLNQTNSTVRMSKVQNTVNDTTMPAFCTIDGKRYNLIGKTLFMEGCGCYLAKNNNEYDVLGFIDERMFILKHYENLKSESIQSRISGKVDEKTTRYIVKLGLNKFILNVSDNDMEFVMDLC